MRKDKLRFGILGCGVIGPHHAAAITALNEEASLVAVSDTIPEHAQQLAQQYGVASYQTMQDLLARDDIDVINICTPSGMHAEHAIAAMEAGKHVVIEKPVDITLPAIDKLIAVQRETGRKATVISQHRFDPASQVVHQAAQDGRFGRLTLGNALVRWWRSQGYYDSGAWRGTWAMDGGGVLMNQSIHSVDLLLWMMGPVAEVSAYTDLLAHERLEVEDTGVAILRFASGALGIIEGTTTAYPGLSARLEISGDRGSATIDDDHLAYFHSAADGEQAASYGGRGEGNQADLVLPNEEPQTSAGSNPGNLSTRHREQISDFINAIHQECEPLVTLEEGRRAVAVILAIYESAGTGRPALVEGAHV